MTTIIVDRKEGKVYSDSRCTNTTVSGVFKKKEQYTHSKVKKIYRVKGHIITGCGSLGMLLHVVKRFHKDSRLPNSFFVKSKYDHDSTIIMVSKQCLGKNYTARYELSVKNLPFRWKRVKVEKYLLGEDVSHSIYGSGQLLAMGALEQGASPEEAIKIASKHDMYTDDDVKVVCL